MRNEHTIKNTFPTFTIGEHKSSRRRSKIGVAGSAGSTGNTPKEPDIIAVLAEGQKQMGAGFKELATAFRNQPNTNRQVDKQNRGTQIVSPVWTPAEGMPLPNGRMFPNGQFGMRYSDQHPGMLFDNGLVWVAATTTTGEDRFRKTNMAFLEEGTIVIPATTDRPHLVVFNPDINSNELRALPRPHAGEVILGGINNSKQKLKIKTEFVDEHGNKSTREEEVTPRAGYYTSTLTGKDIIPLFDNDRFILYRKNDFGQYLNKDGHIITMNRNGDLILKENIQPVRSIEIHNRGNDGKLLPRDQWEFYYDSKKLPSGLKPKFTAIISTGKDGKEEVQITFEKNKHKTILAENGEAIVLNSANKVITSAEDPHVRLDYHYPSLRRIEHYETLPQIDALMPQSEKDAWKAEFQKDPKNCDKFDEGEGNYLDKHVRGRLLPKPVFEINVRDNPGFRLKKDANGNEINGEQEYRYIDADEFEPEVLKDGLFKHDTQTPFDPRIETVSQQLRRGYYYADAFSPNDKKITKFRMRNLNEEDRENVLFAEYSKPTGKDKKDDGETGRVKCYYPYGKGGKSINPGSIYKRPGDDQLCLLVETPDFIYQGNNRVLWEVELEEDKETGKLLPIMEKRLMKHGDCVNSQLFDWHPQKELQPRGGPQNSGASDPYKGRLVWGYAIDPTSYQIIENFDETKQGWINKTEVFPTEAQVDGKAASFHRDDMYGAVTQVADEHAKLLYGKNTDDFVTVRAIYAFGVGSTIKKDAYERIKHGVMETLGFSSSDTFKGSSKNLAYSHPLQTKYVAPVATIVSGLTTAAVFGASLPVIAAAAVTGGIVVSAITAAFYYHYIYDQSDRRKKWHTQEMLEKGYLPKSIYEGDEKHKVFLEGLRNDLKLWFWDGWGMEKYFEKGGFKAQRDYDNDFWKWSVGSGIAGCLSVAAALTPVGLACAGGLALVSVGLGAVAGYDAVISRLINHNTFNAMAYSYTDAEVKRQLEGGEHEAKYGFDYVRQSFQMIIKRALDDQRATQSQMLKWLNETNGGSTYERYR